MKILALNFYRMTDEIAYYYMLMWKTVSLCEDFPASVTEMVKMINKHSK